MRKFRVVAAALAVSLLAGCSSGYTDHQREGGITPVEAERALEAIDGIASAAYSTEEWYSPGEGGLFSSEGMDVYLEVRIDDHHSIADPEQFLDYLARTAWSVNDHYPKGAVVIVITGGIEHYFDWVPAVNEVFDDERLILSDYSATLRDRDWGEREVPIAVSASLYGQAFGRWPSAEVETPRGLLLDEAPDYPVVPALSDISFATYDNEVTEEDCYTISFTRTNGYDGQYPSPVQVELLSATGEVLQSEEVRTGYGYRSFCYDEGDRPPGLGLHIVAEELEWYSGIDETLTVD